MILYPKPDHAFFEEECGEYLQTPSMTLFPLSQYKFKDPCECDQCLVRMACTKYCDDKIKHMKWEGYKKTFKEKLKRKTYNIKRLNWDDWIVCILSYIYVGIIFVGGSLIFYQLYKINPF